MYGFVTASPYRRRRKERLALLAFPVKRGGSRNRRMGTIATKVDEHRKAPYPLTLKNHGKGKAQPLGRR